VVFGWLTNLRRRRTRELTFCSANAWQSLDQRSRAASGPNSFLMGTNDSSSLGARNNHNRDRDDGDCQEHARVRAEAVKPSAHRSTSYMYGTLPEVPNGPISLFGLSRLVGG
jgi:hypothetical protein